MKTLMNLLILVLLSMKEQAVAEKDVIWSFG